VKPTSVRRGLPRSALGPIKRTLGLSIAVLLGSACASHPMLNPDLDRRVENIDLATPPEIPGDVQSRPAAAPSPVAAPPPAAAAAAPAVVPAPPAPPALERLELSVAEVRGQALANNLEIKTELVRPSISKQDRLVAEARFLPTAFARYGNARFDEPGFGPTRSPNTITTEDTEAGIQVPLQTGGNVQISMPLRRTDFGVPGLGDVYDSAAALSLSQPLLRDAGLGVNLAPITIARLQDRQQNANTKLAVMNVLAGADRFYWNLYAATRVVEVRLAQYKRAQEQAHQASRLAAEGVVAGIEVVRSTAGVARRVDDIIQAENTRRQVERELKRAMNRADLAVSSGTVLFCTTPPSPREILIDRKRALQTAVDNRMELLGLELQLAIDSLSVDVARNQKLPKLAFDYSYRFLGIGDRMNAAFDLLGQADYADQSFGLTLEVPIGNQARVANYDRAVLQRELNLTAKEQQRQLIERQVLDTVDQLGDQWQRILAARQETLLAARNFLAEQKQFQQGVRTSTDVLQSADFLAEAQIRELSAVSSYEIAKIDLGFVTGTLLGSGQVKLMDYNAAQAGGDGDAANAPVYTAPLASESTTQETIAEKLQRLGVKPPAPETAPGAPPAP